MQVVPVRGGGLVVGGQVDVGAGEVDGGDRLYEEARAQHELLGGLRLARDRVRVRHRVRDRVRDRVRVRVRDRARVRARTRARDRVRDRAQHGVLRGVCLALVLVLGLARVALIVLLVVVGTACLGVGFGARGEG